MTRVLFLTESFHPVLGGGEQHVRMLSARLAAAGMPALVVTRRGEAQWPREETLDGVRIVRVSPSGPARRGKYAMVPSALAALARERGSFDVLVVRGTRVLGLPGVVAARALGKPVILQPEVNGEMTGEVYTWGTPLDHGLPRRVVRGATALRNRWFRDADACVAMSRAIEGEFLEAGMARERVVYVPHGVDLARFSPVAAPERGALRRRLALPASACVITYTGRLLRGKGLPTLVEAFAELAKQELPVHLLLVGSGAGQALTVEEDLRADAASRGLAERVTFTGRVEAVEDYLKASDIFAFPSVFEALGISLVEAAACGLPAVASRTGGIVDVVEHGRSGLLVEPGDSRALAEALRALVADPALRSALGARAREVARTRFDAEDGVDRYRSLFSEVAGGDVVPSGRVAGAQR